MVRYSEDYPHYRFHEHKGYATPTHRRLIDDHGPCTLHRATFLTDWFGTIARRNSLCCEDLARKLGECFSFEGLTEWLQELRGKRDYIPRCEWVMLIERARQHHKLLNVENSLPVLVAEELAGEEFGVPKSKL
jgi:hypothetical protein